MNETLVDRNNITLRDRLKNMVASFGLPRLIIAGFLLLLFNLLIQIRRYREINRRLSC